MWLHRVLAVVLGIFLAVACRLFSWGMQTLSCSRWRLVPWPGMEPGSPVFGVRSLSHWTTRKVPIWSSLIVLFSQAAIIEYHRLGWLKQHTFIFSRFWRLEVWDQGTSSVGVWWGLFLWLADGHLLTVSSRGFSSVHTCLGRARESFGVSFS